MIFFLLPALARRAALTATLFTPIDATEEKFWLFTWPPSNSQRFFYSIFTLHCSTKLSVLWLRIIVVADTFTALLGTSNVGLKIVKKFYSLNINSLLVPFVFFSYEILTCEQTSIIERYVLINLMNITKEATRTANNIALQPTITFRCLWLSQLTLCLRKLSDSLSYICHHNAFALCCHFYIANQRGTRVAITISWSSALVTLK